MRVVSQDMEMVFPIVVEAIEKNIKSHWSTNVQQLTQNVKMLLDELEPVHYKKCLERMEKRELTTRLEENTRRNRWERIEMAALVNMVLAIQ